MDEQTFYTRTAGAIREYLRQRLKLDNQTCLWVRSASGPRVLTLWISVNPTYAKNIIAMEEELSMAAMLDRGQTIRVGRGHRGTLAIEVPKPPELSKVNIPARILPRHRGIRPGLGFDLDFRPTGIDFTNPIGSHLLLPGMTGSGKTNAARLLIWQLVRANEPDHVRLLLLDVKKRGIGFEPFSRLPHLLHPIITEETMAQQALQWCKAEINRRAEEKYHRPAIFICVDEAQTLLQIPWFVRQISDLVAVGREFNVHVVALVQDPTAEQLGSQSIKRNMLRLVGRTTDAQASVTASGIKDSGAHRLTGPGDMLLINTEPVRIAVAYLGRDDLNKLTPMYVDTVPELNAEELGDLEITEGTSSEGMLDPRYVATSLLAGRGIQWLRRYLGIGVGRATTVKRYADSLRSEIEVIYRTGIPGVLAPGGVACNSDDVEDGEDSTDDG